MITDNETMAKAEKALALIKQIAETETPEEEFERRKEEGDEEVADYEDSGEMESDMSDDRLMDAYGEYMDVVRAAKEIMK